jgi:hypothetical protein
MYTDSVRQLHKGPQGPEHLQTVHTQYCLGDAVTAHMALAGSMSVMTVAMMHAAEVQLTSITKQTLIAL